MRCSKGISREHFNEGDVVRYFFGMDECYAVVIEDRENAVWCRDVTDNSYVEVPKVKCTIVRSKNE